MKSRINRLRKDWEALGRQDLYWSVLSEGEKTNRRWDEEAFYNRGKKQISRWMKRLKSYDLQYDSAMDFGCGPGRLTFALADYFEHVDGVDISQPALEAARQSTLKPENVELILNTRRNLEAIVDEQYDFVLSLITLQHMPPDVAMDYVREFHRVLRPGGHLFFQLPSHVVVSNFKTLIYKYTPNVVLRWVYRRVLGRNGFMEMNGIKKAQLTNRLSEIGFEVLKRWEDQSAGPSWKSYRYLCQKG